MFVFKQAYLKFLLTALCSIGLPMAGGDCVIPLKSIEFSSAQFKFLSNTNSLYSHQIYSYYGYWKPHIDMKHWVKMNFEKLRTIIGVRMYELLYVETNSDGTKYSVSYSADGTTWTTLKEDKDSKHTMYYHEEHRSKRIRKETELTFPYPIVTKHLKVNIDLGESELSVRYFFKVLSPEDSCGVKPMDVVIALEDPYEWGIFFYGFSRAKYVAMNMVEDLSNGLSDTVKIGFLTYGDEANVLFDLNNDLDVDTMVSTIFNIKPSSSSNVVTDVALQKISEEMFTAQKGDRSYAPNVLIVITDGLYGGVSVSAWAQELQAMGTSIYTLSMTENMDTDTLYNIASSPDQQLSGVVSQNMNLLRIKFEMNVEDLDFVHGDYVFSGLLRDYSTAENYCRGLGGSLVAVDSADDNNFLVQTADQYQDLCQDWWLGLHGQQENLSYWSDGSMVQYTNFSQTAYNSTSSVGTLLQSDGGWTIRESFMVHCSICKYSRSVMDITLLSETYDIFVEEVVKFVVILKSLTPEKVILHFQDEYSCTVEPNQSIDVSTRISLLSNFYLTDAHDGLIYTVMNLHFSKEGNFIISAETSSKTSIPQLITVTNGSVDELSCLVSTTVDGTGYAPQIATKYFKTEEITISVHLGSNCGHLIAEITDWSLARRIPVGTEACYKETDYEVFVLNPDDVEVTGLDFVFKPDVMPLGNFEICFAVALHDENATEVFDKLCEVVKFVVILKSLTPEKVILHFQDEYSCTVEPNKTMDVSTRISLLSNFYLTDAHDGLIYTVMNLHFSKEGNFIISAETSSKTSIPQLITVTNGSVDELSCLISTTVDGTGYAPQIATKYLKTEEITISVHLGSNCGHLIAEITDWSLARRIPIGTEACYEETDYEVFVLNPDDVEVTGLDFVFKPDVMPIGNFEICFAVALNEDNVTDVFDDLCEFITVSGVYPLTLIISPNEAEVFHNFSTPLVLNASESFDPNDANVTISFTWKCSQNGGQCDFVTALWPHIGSDTQQLPVSEGVLELPADSLTEGQNYTFTLSLEAPYLQGSNHTLTVYQSEFQPVVLNLTCVSRCSERSRGDLEMHIQCDNCPNTVISLTIYITGIGLVTDTSTVLTFFPDYTGFIIDGDFLNPFQEYILTVTDLRLVVRAEFQNITINDYNLFLVLVNGTSEATGNLQVTISNSFSCMPDLKEIGASDRSQYPLSHFPLPALTEGMRYIVISYQCLYDGHQYINVSMNLNGEVLTSTDYFFVHNDDEHHCLSQLQIEGTSATMSEAKVYTRSHQLYFTSSYVWSCDDVVIVSYNWTAYHYQDNDPTKCTSEAEFELAFVQTFTNEQGLSFRVPPKTLPVGYHKICLVMIFTSDSSSDQHINKGCEFITVSGEYPLTLIISPNEAEVFHNFSTPLVLNASESFDPNDANVTISFTWKCSQNGGQCDFVTALWPHIGSDTQQLPVSEGVLELPADSLTEGQNYTFTLSLEAPYLQGSNHTLTVYQSEFQPVVLNLTCVSRCSERSRGDLEMHIQCDNCPNTVISLTIYITGIGLVTDTSTVLTFFPDYTGFIIDGDFLNPFQEYILTVTDLRLVVRAEFQNITINDYNLFLVLVNGTSEATGNLQVTISNSISCMPDLKEIGASDRSQYPLSHFPLPALTEGMRYIVISYQCLNDGHQYINVSMNLNGEVLTSTDYFFVHNDDEHHCLSQLQIEGTSATMSEAKVYTRSHQLYFTSSYVWSCDDVVIVSYNWTAYHYQDNDPTKCTSEAEFELAFVQTFTNEQGLSFRVPPKTLPVGYHKFCLVMIFTSDSSSDQHINKGCGYILMKVDPLVIVLSPRVTFLSLPSSQPLLLDASHSYNPNSDDQSNIGFSWKCVQGVGNCNFVDSVWPGQNIQETLPVTDSVLSLPAGSLSIGQAYQFTLTVTKSNLPGSSIEITVLSSNPTTPSLVISCTFGCGQKLNPSERLALSAACTNCGETGLPIETFFWSVSSNLTNSQLPDEEVISASTTGVSQSTLVLSAFFFHPSDVYSITVTGTNSYSESGNAVYVVPINSPPLPGTCSIAPPSGQALSTQFTVTCTGFQDPDTPLVYKIFRDQQNSSGVLIKSSFQSTISHLTLPTGPVHTNYTHNLTVFVFDDYATSTSLGLTVQVLNPTSTNQTVSKTVLDLVQNLTTTSASDLDSPDFLGFASSVAVILNEEAIIDTTNESIVQRSETRETLLTTLGTVQVDSQDVVQQMAEIVSDLTSEKAAVTENIQDLAVNVSNQLTESLGSVAESAPTVAKTIAVKQLSTLENLIQLTVAAEEAEPDPGQPARNIIGKTVEEKTRPILELYEKIGDAMLKGLQSADEEPLKLEAKKMSLALAWSPVDKEENVTISSSLSSGDTEGTFQISLKKSLENTDSNNIQAVNFQVQVMSDNPYIWDDSASNVNLPVVNVLMKSRDANAQKLQLSNLTEPASIHITTNISLLNQWSDSEMNATLQTLNVTLVDNKINASETKLLRISANQTSMIRIRTIDTPLTIQIHYLSNNNITVAQIRDVGKEFPRPLSSRQKYGNVTQDPDVIILNKVPGNESFYTVGFTLQTGQSYNSGGINQTVIAVSVETYTVECSYWKEETEEWDTQGCQVNMFTSMERLFCQCDHLTAFSGGLFIAPNTIDPIADLALFLTFFDNPVVVTTVLGVWGIYFLLLYWARQNDKEDAMKVGMTVLRDNDPKDKYVYLICAVTSWWPGAGTTANVFFYLRSKYKQSARHMLADPQRKLFTKGSENWFVLTTSEKLGRIKSVVVWHDNKGHNPSWYLKEIVVHDIQTKEVWHCLYDDWLAVDSSHGLIQAEIPSLVNEDIVNHRLYQLSLKSSKDFRNSHLWISIFSKPEYSEFTRAQRLTCGLSLLLTSMLSSLMFLGIPTDDPEDQVQAEGLVFSLSSVVIGIQSGLLMFPINTIIIQLFMRTAHKVVPEKSEVLFSTSRSRISASEFAKGDMRKSSQSLRDASSVKKNQKKESKVSFAEHDESITVDEVDIAMSRGEVCDNTSKQKVEDEKKAPAKKPFKLPWWCMYITWTIAVSTCLICSYFVMLYGLKYGYQRSVDWLVSFFTSFFQSAFVTQPIKVLLVAVLLTQILRRPVQYDSWQLNQEIEEDDVEQMTVKHGGSVHNRYYTPPLSTTTLEKIRKRINMDARSRFILYEILLYLTFVAVVLLMIYGHRNINMTYRVTKATENMFTEEETGFGKVGTVESMWEYLGDQFVSNLLTDDSGSGLTACLTSYLIGKARLRQLRVKSGLCSPPEGMAVYSHVDCRGAYWITDEDTTSYNGTWNQTADPLSPNITEYTYQSAYHLLTLPVIGRLATYSGGGYVKELPRIPNDTTTVLSELQNSDWIDQYTRAIFVEFSLYNPNVNLFSMVVLVFEFTNLGKIFPTYQIYTTNLYHYNGGLQQFVAFCEALFVIYIVTFTYLEVSKFRGMPRKEYFNDEWSYVEIIILALSYTVFGLFIQRIVSVNYSLQLYKESKGQSFVSFHPALSSDVVLQYTLAFLSGFVILKFFKLLRFNVRMSILSGTLNRCKKILFQFLITVFLYTMAFALLGLLVFGPHIQEYSNFGETIITLFNFALGVSDYYGLWEANHTIGPFFFFTFSFLFQCLLIMIFCSIINDAYATVVAHVMTLKTEVHMVDFIMKRIKLLTVTDKKKKIRLRKKMYQINTEH